MLTVTDEACAYLAALLVRAEAPEGTVLRIKLGEGDELSMGFHSTESGDVCYRHEGKEVLVIDPTTSDHLADQVLAMSEDEDGEAELALCDREDLEEDAS